MVGGRPDVLSEAAKECGWLRRVRSGDAQREASCDAGSELGGESPATEALSEAGGADGIFGSCAIGSRFGGRDAELPPATKTCIPFLSDVW